jgi:hypothetical protein
MAVVAIDSIEGTAKSKSSEMKEIYNQFPKSFYCL